MSDSDSQPMLDAPPASDAVTDYDLANANRYLRLLAAAEEGAPWMDAAHHILGLDCKADSEGAERIYETHLKRARWMTREGYKDLLLRSADR